MLGGKRRMFSFIIKQRTIIHFQEKGIEDIGNYLDSDKKILIVTDEGLVRSGIVDRLRKILDELDKGYVIYDRVRTNPTIGMVEKGYQFYKENGCEELIAIGGGSSIDTAKAIAILATNEGDITNYFGAFRVPHPPAPLIAIPTTAGTGSEISTQISIKDENTGSKFAIRSYHAQPSVAILDSTLLETLPENIAAETSIDAMTHLIEAYISKGANVYTDGICLQGINMVGKYLTAFVSDRKNKEAAQGMLYASLLGGIAISYARTGATHTITRPMGDTVSHGLANAIVLPYVLEFNRLACVEKFAKIAEALEGQMDGTSLEKSMKVIQIVKTITKNFGLPSTLKEVGLNEDQIPDLAQKAYELDTSKLNPRELSIDNILSLMEKAYWGY